MDQLCTSIEAVELSNGENNQSPTTHNYQNDSCDYDDNDLWCDDGVSFNDSNEELDMRSDLDREWHRRYNQFHTIGYRDGLTAGKEAAAQEGFNIGFKQSVLVGYKWGLVRGITSVLACLPNDVKEKLVGTLERKEKLQNLYESVHSVSTKDALNFFNDEILADQLEEHCKHSKRHSEIESIPDKISSCGQLGKYYEKLESLLEYSAIKMPLPMRRQ